MSIFGRRLLLLAVVWSIALSWMRRLAIAHLERNAWTGYALLHPGQQHSASAFIVVATLAALLALIVAPPVLAAWLWQRLGTS
jgi:steroid 5-alpha reductase family enzyme